MLKKFFVFTIAILFLGGFNSCKRDADLINREDKLLGIWQYYVVKESPRWSAVVHDISDEWLNDQIEFVAPDQVFYYDAETDEDWEGIWQLERTSDAEYILTMSLINQTTGALQQITADLEWISNVRMRLIDEQREKIITYRLEKY